MDNQVKNIMLNMYPKKEPQYIEEGENELPEPSFQHPIMMKSDNIEIKKWAYAWLIGAISVFLFSSFFLDFVDEICMKRDTSAFNSSGDPKMILILTIFVILTLISRTIFSLI